jgi:thymidylate synthase (FAD)
MYNTINVLDHGVVRLVDSMGSDLSIVRAARVSYNAEWRAGEDSGSDKRLINYLLKNRHTTPFESVVFQFEVKAPIFVLRQWHRHRMSTINEVSARYTELPEEFYVPQPEDIGVQSKDNKQARDMGNTTADLEAKAWQAMNVIKHHESAFKLYKELITQGWPRELARTVLPLATYSHMFWKSDLHNLLHFLSLRLHEHAQYEIRVYAKAMLELITPIVPNTIEAWKGLQK